MEVVETQPALKEKKILFNLFRTAVQIKTRRKWLIKMKLPAADFCIDLKFVSPEAYCLQVSLCLSAEVLLFLQNSSEFTLVSLKMTEG